MGGVRAAALRPADERRLRLPAVGRWARLVGLVVSTVSAAERRKGLNGEREVAELLAGFDFVVRGLDAAGDHLALGHGLVLHVEVKRQEVTRPWQWIEQARSEAPPGTLPVVFFRRSRSEWLALAPAAELLERLARA